MIAARVMRIMCATTTRVSVAAGSMERYSLSPNDKFILTLEIPGNQPSLIAKNKIRIYATKNSGNEMVVRVKVLTTLS